MVGIWIVLRCICVPNLEIVTSIGGELWYGQAQNGVNFDFEVKFYLEGHGQSTPQIIGILTKVFYTYGPNLMILAWMGNELWSGQAWWRTDWRTDRRRQRQYLEGQNWPRVKIQLIEADWCIYETIFGSDNGLGPERCQAIMQTNGGIGPLGTNFNEILIEIYIFWFKKMHLKMLSAKWDSILFWPQCVKSPSRVNVKGQLVWPPLVSSSTMYGFTALAGQTLGAHVPW